MNEAGLSLYEWNPQGKEQDGLLLSGFVAALNAFAQHDRGEQIKKITLDPTTFVFSRGRGLVFTILTRDPDFEKVITHIIEDLRERFIETFGGTISDFRGSISQFRPFDVTVNEILKSYGYFDYQRLRNLFDSDAGLRSILIFDKESGEPLYVKAKEYIDRKALSFQAPIVAKSAERLVSECFGEVVVDVNMISEKMRSLLFRSTLNVHLIEEANLVSTEETSPVATSEKKASKIVGSPTRLQTITSDPFVIFDHSGKIAYSSFKNRLGDLSSVVVNGVTAYESSKNVFQQVFKESAWVSALSGKDSTYALFDVGGYIALVQIKREKEFEPSSVLRKVHQFQEMFGQ
jgi:hypothetical protein